MSKDSLSFYNYVQNNGGEDIEKFKMIFGEKMEKMPDRIASSKVLMIILGVESREEYDVFRDVYMEYFKKRILNVV